MSLPPPLPFSLSLLLFLTSLLLLLTTTTTSTTISSFSISLSPWHPSQNQTLLSPNSAFAAGFHPLPTTSPTLFTFSIWYYHHNTTLIWSANQKSPVTASAALEVTPAGVLRLAGNSSGPNLWPPSSPASNSKSTQLNLSDAGELVFGEWSSFDFPTDTVVATQNTNGAASLRNGNFEFVNWTHLVFNGSDRYWSWSSWAGAFRRLEEDGKVNSSTDLTAFQVDYQPYQKCDRQTPSSPNP